MIETAATVGGEVAPNLVHSRALDADCNAVHEPQAALCDLGDSALLSERTNRYGGPSWGNYGDDSPLRAARYIGVTTGAAPERISPITSKPCR